MCIREVYTEIYPTSVERRRERLIECNDYLHNRPCQVLSVERSPCYLPFGEAPAAMVTADDAGSERSASQRTAVSRASSGRRKARPSLKKGQEFVINIDLPFGRSKKKQRDSWEAEDTDVILVPESRDVMVSGSHGGHGNRPPVPPPAPMPPSYGYYHPGPALPSPGHDSTVFHYPPPRYREEWTARERPLVVQVSPPTSPRRIAAVPAPAQHSRQSSRESGDQFLREQVGQARRDRQRAEDERQRATAERVEAAALNRSTNIQRELSLRERDQETIRLRNLELEQRARDRDQDRQLARRQQEREREARQRQYEQDVAAQRRRDRERRTAATRDTLLDGGRVAHRLRPRQPIDLHHDGGYRSPSEESYWSAPGDARVLTTTHRRRNADAREHGERILDGAARRWQDREDRRTVDAAGPRARVLDERPRSRMERDPPENVLYERHVRRDEPWP